MKTRDLARIGIPPGQCAETAKQLLQKAQSAKQSTAAVLDNLKRVAESPARFEHDETYGNLARLLLDQAAATDTFKPRQIDAPYRIWGENLEATAVQQMTNACKLPVAVSGALMPDAHVGYGLPIGGVLATHDAVIPYAVGVDIACRMKMTVLDLPLATLTNDQRQLTKAIEGETRFGIGATFRTPREHGVMDADWRVSDVTAGLKDRAWAQLGTSGSGNHFVEFGELTVTDGTVGLPPGKYLALLSHSGSRGAGAQIAQHYSRLARDRHPELPKELSHLAWLDLASDAGQEYWAAMELMGRYAAANHELIHRHIARALGVDVRLDIENHHNFAWRERHRLPDGFGGRGDRPSQGRDARRRRRARHHPWLHGHAWLRRPRKGCRSVVEFRVARRGTQDEPDQGQGDLHVGHCPALSARARRDAPVGRPGRGPDGLQGHRRGYGRAGRSRRAAGTLRAAPRENGAQWGTCGRLKTRDWGGTRIDGSGLRDIGNWELGTAIGDDRDSDGDYGWEG